MSQCISFNTIKIKKISVKLCVKNLKPETKNKHEILKIIRFQNLLMLAFMQLVFRYLFLEQSYVDLALTDFNYILLVIATVCIAAGGYVINNIMDQDTDEIAKPHIGLFFSTTKRTS